MSPLFKALVSHGLVAVLGGGAGGAIALALVPNGAQPTITGEGSASGEGSVEEPSSSRHLETGNLAGKPRRLEERLAALERQSHAQQAIARYLDQAGSEGATDEAKAEGLLAASQPAFESAVRTVMEKIETERREERQTEARNRQMERATDAANLLETKLRLDPNQKAQVEQAFIGALESVQALRGDRSGSGPGSREEWRKAMSDIRGKLDQEISGLLSADQRTRYADLQKSDEEMGNLSRIFWGGGRGPGQGSGNGPRASRQANAQPSN